MSAPPITGPSAIGIRRISECIETPIALFRFGRTCTTKLIVAGSDRDDQARKKIAATRTAGHVGIKTPGGVRNDLSRSFPKPHFYHFGTDIAGKRLISDAGPTNREGPVYLAELDEAGKGPAKKFTYLVNPRSSWKSEAHIHPFLSPDGTMGFFNSDESGILQAYMLRNLPG